MGDLETTWRQNADLIMRAMPTSPDLATLTAERDRYAAALDEIAGATYDDEVCPDSNFERLCEIARKAREGTGQ